MKTKFYLFFFLINFFSATLWAAPSLQWRALSPGLEEAQYNTQDAHQNPVSFLLYKMDLKRYKIQPVQASDFRVDKMYVKDMVQKNGALIGVNGGFFDPAYKSLGLLVKEGRELNPVKPVSWWGIFLIESGVPKVVKSSEYDPRGFVEFAIQAGPRLVENGSVVSLKPNISQKTFIAVTPNQEIILGVTDKSALDAEDFARILAQELKVSAALNLDGGSSTQLYAKIGNYEKETPVLASVANGLVVLPRK